MTTDEITPEKLEQGNRVQEYFDVVGLSQSYFAEKLSISRQQLNAIIKGKRPIDSISAGLSRLGCNINRILTGEGDFYNDTEFGIELKNAPANLFVIKGILNKASEKLKAITVPEPDIEAGFEDSHGTYSVQSMVKDIEENRRTKKKAYEESFGDLPVAAGKLKDKSK